MTVREDLTIEDLKKSAPAFQVSILNPHASAIPIILAVAIFVLFSVVCSIRSDGFLEADSCTHYLYARFALTGARVPALPVHRSRFSLTSNVTHHLMSGGESVSAAVKH